MNRKPRIITNRSIRPTHPVNPHWWKERALAARPRTSTSNQPNPPPGFIQIPPPSLSPTFSAEIGSAALVPMSSLSQVKKSDVSQEQVTPRFPMIIEHEIANVLPEVSNSRLAVVAHVYYCDLWNELARYLRNIPLPFDLYVTMVEGQECKSISILPVKEVFVLPNNGMDIGPFVHVINKIDLSQYDYVCKVHSKRSIHRSDPAEGARWRYLLLDGILQSPRRIASILYSMMQNNIGLVGCSQYISSVLGRSGQIEGRVAPVLHSLLDRYGIHQCLNACYVAGTVFWINAQILQTIKAGGLTLEMFEPAYIEESQYDKSSVTKDGIIVGNAIYDLTTKVAMDGQLAHAVERLFGILTDKMGFQIRGYD